MNRLKEMLLLAAVVGGVSIAASLFAAQKVEGKYDTWLTRSPQEQLYLEALDDQKGMGRVFVPVMTSPANEPLWAVLSGDSVIGQKPMGSSIFVMPGRYTVVLGTGAIEQRQHIPIDVGLEQTVVVDPSWAALTVDVIDETRNNVQQALQIYDAIEGTSYGIIAAVNPELGEQLQTVLLPPGLYKIVERGRDFSTYLNFATVQLSPGTYTAFTIVIKTTTSGTFFTGAGMLSRAGQLTQIKEWKIFGSLTGQLKITSNNSSNTAANSFSTTYEPSLQFDNQLLFDHFPHYYLSNNLMEFGAIKQPNIEWLINQDQVQLKNTYVYYLLSWLGGYARFDANTHFMPSYDVFAEGADITLLNLDNQIKERIQGAKHFETAPPFLPLTLKEGIGVNLTPVKHFDARVSIRAGLGYRQLWASRVYSLSSKAGNSYVYRETEEASQRGLETSLISNLSPTQNLVITTELDLFRPFTGDTHWIVGVDNTTLLNVSKHVILEHKLTLNRDRKQFKGILQKHTLTVGLTYYLF